MQALALPHSGFRVADGAWLDIYWHGHLIASLDKARWSRPLWIDHDNEFGPALHEAPPRECHCPSLDACDCAPSPNAVLLQLNTGRNMYWGLPCFYLGWRSEASIGLGQIVPLGRNAAQLLRVLRGALAPIVQPATLPLLDALLALLKPDGVTYVYEAQRLVPWHGHSGPRYLALDGGLILWHDMVVALFYSRGVVFGTMGEDGIWSSRYDAQHWPLRGPQGQRFEAALRRAGVVWGSAAAAV